MELFPHNREAYENAVRLFETEKRVCIIRPTGTGKSVIIAEFVNQNPSKRHLLLAPGSHIFNEIQKHIRTGKISSSTYIGLKLKKALFKSDSFEYIYLDEFHRLGAEVWGGAVERLLKLNPNAKVLGTSATPIRYLDDNRNMASEIFKDCIADQMNLNFAIANSILPAPVYVSALYSVREEAGKLKKRILSSKAVDKQTLIRDLDNKIIDWERSSGVDVVIKKHLGAERRRIIVFCKDWEHLSDAQKILDPIFKTIYDRIESLSLYSKKKERENEDSLKLFTGEHNRAIVLYTIDKVNEGLHTNNCNTVILLRDTVSPIVFYQQIGRAFSIKPANRPLILDLVNNFNNIQLDSFKKDFEHELKAQKRDNYAANEERAKAAIDFIDEIHDIRLLFDSFVEKIDVWKDFYDKAKAYFEEYGHLYVSAADKELQDWVRIQRKAYLGNKMGKEREAKLRAIGMDLDEEIPARWLTVLHELEEWKKKHGALPGIEEDQRLYTWMVRQRQAFRAGSLSNGQIKMLQKTIRLEDDTRVKDRVDRLIEHFKDGNGTPTDKVVAHDLARIKSLNWAKRLPGETLIALRDANVPIDFTLNDYTWLENAKKLLDYYKENGATPKPGPKASLYFFCLKERRYLGIKHPCAKFIESDQEVKMVYDGVIKIISSMGSPEWDDQFDKLKKLARTYGYISADFCEKNLMEWMWRQRRFIRDGILSPEKTNKLLTIREIDWHGSTKGRW